MSSQRVFKSSDHMQVSDGEPIRSVVQESEHSVIVAWHVEPGQTIAAHTHPEGQDTWTILSGHGDYQIDEQGNTVVVTSGDVVVGDGHLGFGIGAQPWQKLRIAKVVKVANNLVG